MVTNMLVIIMEEREGTAGTVGLRQSTCLSSTELFNLCKVAIQSRLGEEKKRHAEIVKIKSVANDSRNYGF